MKVNLYDLEGEGHVTESRKSMGRRRDRNDAVNIATHSYKLMQAVTWTRSASRAHGGRSAANCRGWWVL